jgi:hypothetical protein
MNTAVKKIERLTAAQERDMVSYRDEWLALGYSTKPIDLDEAASAVTAVYAQIGKPAPMVVHCTSPWQMAYMRSAYQALGKLDFSQLWSQLDSQLESQLWSQLWSQLDSQLESQLDSQLRSQLRSQRVTDYCYWTGTGFGWYYAGWFAFVEFADRIGVKYNAELFKQWKEWIALARSVHGFWAFDGICFITDRPTKIAVDDQNRLHCEDGPALEYADGYCLYSWHGVRVDWDKAHILEKPETINIKEIEKETNAEVRRVMTTRYGQERYLIDSNAKAIHCDDWGTLYKKDQGTDEPLVMVKVVNSTAEPDGTFKDYFIRVPPTMTTARGAVGWTFGYDVASEYQPVMQT